MSRQRGVPQPGPGGGVPLLGVPHLGYPPIRPGQGGYPTLGTPHPVGPGHGVPLLGGHLGTSLSDLAGGCPCWVGGTPAGGVTHLRYPTSDLAGGYPCKGYPTSGNPLSDLAGGATPAWGYPTSGIPPPIRPGQGYPCWGPRVPPCQTWTGGTPAGGVTPPRIPPIRPGWGYPCQGGYPTSGNRWSTWYTAVGMPLVFTQEDFLFLLIFLVAPAVAFVCLFACGQILLKHSFLQDIKITMAQSWP